MYVRTIQPVGWHFHPDHTVYVLEGGTLAVYFNGSDEKKIFELPAGLGIISSSLSDAAVNAGDHQVVDTRYI